jgi:hypothetical protein
VVKILKGSADEKRSNKNACSFIASTTGRSAANGRAISLSREISTLPTSVSLSPALQ